MINTMAPASTPGHDEKRNEVLERLSQEYGAPDQKQREANKKLGKDEFFKIMVTQIQHQDPLKPYQNEQMAAQMAQFSSLEQMVNVNQNLEKLSQAQQPLHQLGAAGLIGKYVTADSSRIAHTEGRLTDISFELPADAEKVRLIIMNDRGENVREIEKSELKKGSIKVEWDGKTESKFPAKTGQYLVQISASTDQGKNVPVQTQHTSMVHGIAYENKETVLLTGDVTRPQKLMLKNIYKIVDAAQAKNSNAQASAPSPMVTGLPPGMEIGGLEELIKQQLAEKGQGQPAAAQEDETAKLIDSADRQVAGYDPGISSRYAPVDVNAMRKGTEKPVVQAAPTADQIRQMLEQAQDISAANPVAEAMREGKLPIQQAGNKSEMENVNSAARAMGMGQQAAGRQSVQSSEDGSVAGSLLE